MTISKFLPLGLLAKPVLQIPNQLLATSPRIKHMSRTRPIFDGLWHCLCPSFAVTVPLRNAPVKRILSSARPLAPSINPRTKRRSPDRPRTYRTNARQDNTSRNEEYSEPSSDGPYDPFRRQGQSGRVDLNLEGQSTAALYDQLRISASNGHTTEVNQIATCLVGERGEAPNVRLYRSLILVNVNAPSGSADRLRFLLDEMTDSGLAADSGVCHDALKVSRH